MKNTLETRLGLYFALVAVAAVIILELVGVRDFMRGGYVLKARFDNIQELQKGDAVRVAGVDVGRVNDIRLSDDKVEVEMRIRGKTVVRTDSKASIKFAGLMGQNYVAISFGTTRAPAASDNAVLETEEQADLNALMVKLQGVADGVQGLATNFSGENLSSLLGPVTDFLKENNPKLSAILGNMQVVSTRIVEGQGTVGRMINEPEVYNFALVTLSNLNTRVDQFGPLFDNFKLTLDEAKAVVTQVNQGQGTLGRLVKDDALYRETTTMMANLREVMEKINQGKGSVGELVNDRTFLKNAKLTLQKVEKATEGLEDQGPLSVMGTMVNSLF